MRIIGNQSGHGYGVPLIFKIICAPVILAVAVRDKVKKIVRKTKRRFK